MEPSTQSIGKTAIGFALFCLIAVGVISGFVFMGGSEAESIQPVGTLMAATPDFDHKGSAAFQSLYNANDAYLSGYSSERTLAEFYSRRQYPGSPPGVPHPIKTGFDTDQACLSCHEKGGWVAEWNRHTPVTPHPENLMCQQCHVSGQTDSLFVDSLWESVNLPRLGSAQLPGSPPPFPHEIQMRENCIACHTGPGAVTEIRTNHANRGSCRQCHVPLTMTTPFNRDL